VIVATSTRTRHVGGETIVENADVRLSPREIEVLALAARGIPPKAIAETLWLSVHTVRNHLKSAARKLGTRNRVQVVLAAYRLGIVSMEEAA
jgi:DNA-binding CsgD family transcriptional regulator